MKRFSRQPSHFNFGKKSEYELQSQKSRQQPVEGKDCKSVCTGCELDDWEKGFKAGYNLGRADFKREAVKKIIPVLNRMQKMLDANFCDCPAEGHMCGRPDAERELNEAIAAIESLPVGKGG